jgi:hypothetical protein
VAWWKNAAMHLKPNPPLLLYYTKSGVLVYLFARPDRCTAAEREVSG